jgi:DNA-binding NtrC family response regulator
VSRPSTSSTASSSGVLFDPQERSIRVLAIDDERAMLEFLETALEPAGCEVRTALSGARGRELFETWRPEVVLVDMLLPDADGLELLRRFKESQPAAEVVVLTGHGTVAKAVEAMRAGAHSFIEKPVTPDALIALLARAVEYRRLVGENRALKQQLEDRFQYGNIIGKSRKMLELFDLVKSVASSDANVLIQGENGTGKELIANALHANSKRVRGPFIKINCAALPKDLIESELFGYRKGAFTGANTDREGLLEAAGGGSLLLDEIGEMPPYLQTKLLRVLQDREYRPIGSDRVVRVDFRLICATNVDVDAALREGKLREDLYFRINTITLRVPPLRERVEDILPLAEELLASLAADLGRPGAQLTDEARQALQAYAWPGNVRELRNVLERALLLSEAGVISRAGLRFDAALEAPSEADESGLTLQEVERRHIERVLREESGHVGRAAARLAVPRSSLYQRLKRLGLESKA